MFYHNQSDLTTTPGLAATFDHRSAASPLGQAFHTLDIRIASLLADGRFAPQT